MKWIIEFILTILYVISFGMFSFSVDFPDGTEFNLNGWLF